MRTNKRLLTPAPCRPRGSPSKRTPEMAERICDAVAKGVPFTHAARLAGICYSSFCEWRNSDPAFRERLEDAVAAAIEKRLGIIQEMAVTDWRCAAWYLEHIHPEHFARNRLELTGPGGAPLAAGVQLYLPKKDNSAALVEVAPAAPALTEGTPNGNGG